MTDQRAPLRRAEGPGEEVGSCPNVGGEDYFQAGLALLKKRREKDALRAFARALELVPGEARYLSYFGRCLAATGGDARKAVRLCRDAVEKEFYHPGLHLNLGKALGAAGKHREAQEAFRKGLSLDAQDREIIQELEKMGVRKRPLIPFLPRQNPLNRWLGQVRHHLASGGLAVS